jgi:hypothetical protein
MRKTKRCQIDLIVSLTLLLAGFFVVSGVIRDKILTDADIRTKETACRTANQIAQETDLKTLQSVGEKLCVTIPLGSLPRKGYPKNEEGIKKNIADKVAKTWEMRLEGTKQNYFGGRRLPGKQRCFIHYTYKIGKSKEIDPIGGTEFLKYAAETVYQVGDKSDGCAGRNGGFCMEECEKGQIKVNKPAKPCIGTKSHCCVEETQCESKGGDCKLEQPPNTMPYPTWTCKGNDRCYVSKENYQTYKNYVEHNTGIIGVAPEDLILYPQEYKEEGGKKISETYAIVFASATKQELLNNKEALGAIAVGAFMGGPKGAIGGAGIAGIAKGFDALVEYFEDPDANINNVFIAPLDEVADICEIQTGAS